MFSVSPFSPHYVHFGMMPVNLETERRGSLCCDVREAGVTPRGGFYAAAVTRVLDLFALEADTEIGSCRAAGGGRCTLSIALGRSAGS